MHCRTPAYLDCLFAFQPRFHSNVILACRRTLSLYLRTAVIRTLLFIHACYHICPVHLFTIFHPICFTRLLSLCAKYIFCGQKLSSDLPAENTMSFLARKTYRCHSYV